MDTRQFHNLTNKQMPSLGMLFKEQFRRLFGFVLVLFFIFTIASIGFVFHSNQVAIDNATMQAIAGNKSHLLALAYNNNTEALEMLLRDLEKSIGRVRLTYHQSDASMEGSNKKIPLQFAEKYFGYIEVQFLWWDLLDFRFMGLLLVATVCLFALFVFGYRRLRRLFSREVLHPLEQLNDLISVFDHIEDLPHTQPPSPTSTEMKTIFEAFKTTAKVLAEKEEKERENQILRARNELASQVYHDIASPLTALKLVSQIQATGKEEMEIIRGAVERIEAISQDLRQKKEEGSALALVSLQNPIEQIIAEKKLLAHEQGVNIQSERASAPAYSQVDPVEFKRVLSNLLNNSLEATREKGGCITVSLYKEGRYNSVVVNDTGKGIPPHVLSKLGKRGTTFGKENLPDAGSGLGIYHAKSAIERWGGKFEVSSTPNEGTSVRISLPQSTL
ncbi:MAG: HAMP domain-containing histidine kinase [Bdellovibrionales bacterium]|nr:HAMP domain-containing histidine kinase [Bdellovibrionales bacterium]